MLIGLQLAMTATALACDCKPISVPDAAASAQLVVEGSVVEAELAGDRQAVTLDVHDTLAGDPPGETMSLTLQRCDSEPASPADGRQIWFLEAGESGWISPPCSPRPPPTPETRAAIDAAASGSLQSEEISRVLRAGAPRVRACFAHADPVPGRISPRITIGPGGRVTAAELGCPRCSEALVACAEAALRELVFPDPGEGTVEISWPWNVDPTW